MRKKILFASLLLVLFLLVLIIPSIQASLIGNVWYNALAFLGIIQITNANHLNSDRVAISDIYEQVKAQDNVWSETIPSGDYVRITFEQNLTNANDITIFPRIVSGTPIVEVYEKNKNEKITEFNPLISNEYNKVLLTNLPEGYSQDVFDLKIIGGDVQFDYIVDPTNIILAEYDFPAVGRYGPTTNASNVIVGNVTNNALGTYEISSNTYASDPELRVGPKANAVNITSAVTLNSYFSFNITPSSGYSFNLTNVNFRVARGGASVPRGWGLRSSIDNYANSINVVNVSTQRAVWTNQTNALNSSFKNINSTVTFRLYIYSPATGSTLEFDNITIIGDTFETVTDTEKPQFSGYWDNNGSQIAPGIGYFNTTVTSTNGTVILTFNNVNYTASNNSGDETRFNVTASISQGGTFSYNWSSYGNGTSHNYNISNTQRYTINASADTCTYSSGNWDITCSDNCTISSNVVGSGGIWKAVGLGNIILNANITNFNLYHISGGCNVTCLKGCINYN
jgi:hypothetical protein